MSGVNLLPWRERERAARRHTFLVALAAALLAMCTATALASWQLADRTAHERQRHAELGQQATALDAGIAETQTLQQQRSELTARTQALGEIWAARPLLAATLDELAQTMVVSAHYTSIARRDDWITASGEAATNAAVTHLMRQLAESPWFSEVTLKHMGVAAAPAYGEQAAAFEIVLRVAPPAASEGA